MITLPSPTWIAGGIIASLAIALGAQTLRLSNEQAAHAKDREFYEKQVANSALATLQDEQNQRTKEAAREKEKTDAIESAQNLARAAIVARDAANRSAVSMRKSTAELVARARQGCENTALGTGSTATDDPIGVLANVLGRADDRAGILAAYADSARIAGQTCERQYDSLVKSEQEK